MFWWVHFGIVVGGRWVWWVRRAWWGNPALLRCWRYCGWVGDMTAVSIAVRVYAVAVGCVFAWYTLVSIAAVIRERRHPSPPDDAGLEPDLLGGFDAAAAVDVWIGMIRAVGRPEPDRSDLMTGLIVGLTDDERVAVLGAAANTTRHVLTRLADHIDGYSIEALIADMQTANLNR